MMKVHDVDYIMVGDTQFVRTELAADEEDRLRECIAELERQLAGCTCKTAADEWPGGEL